MTAVSADPPAAVKRYWFTPLAAIALVLIGCLGAPSVGHAQESKTPDRYTEVADKLLSLTKLPLPDCRWHADVTHPEDGSLDDSAWKPISLGANFESGVQVFRCWFTVSQKVNGYDVRGANLKFAMDLQGDGMTMLSIYSNNYSIYRGNADTLEPVSLTTSAQPGQRFLIAVRLEVGDQPRKLVRSEILIEPPASRPDPALLQMEILSLQPILQAYPDPQRRKQLDSAIAAIDFSKLNFGDQAGFDASLQSAQDQLQALQPWVRQFKIRAIGNSHIDMAWLWPWTETVELVRNTFRSALDMMHEYPTFTYTASTARAYEWMEEKYPQLFQ